MLTESQATPLIYSEPLVLLRHRVDRDLLPHRQLVG